MPGARAQGTTKQPASDYSATQSLSPSATQPLSVTQAVRPSAHSVRQPSVRQPTQSVSQTGRQPDGRRGAAQPGTNSTNPPRLDPSPARSSHGGSTWMMLGWLGVACPGSSARQTVAQSVSPLSPSTTQPLISPSARQSPRSSASQAPTPQKAPASFLCSVASPPAISYPSTATRALSPVVRNQIRFVCLCFHVCSHPHVVSWS